MRDVIRAVRAVTPDGERSVNVLVEDGCIRTLDSDLAPTVVLAADEVLLPGLVDTHVHVNEPGRTEWEGFATATRAAARGGVTMLLDMPLNSIPPTCDVPSLQAKLTAAERQCAVDVGFWGGAVPGNEGELAALHDRGVFGFKCFLLPSGVDEFPPLDRDQLRTAMRTIAGFDGLLIAHAEDGECVHEPTRSRKYADFLDSRPPDAEVRAIRSLLETARATGCRVHVVHLSTAQALPALEAARGDGVRVTVETCPHYLTLAAEDVPDGATEFMCCPPIRSAANQDGLWDGLRRGVIDTVVSDHSPCPPALKAGHSGDFSASWGGIASVQLGLPVVWTAAVHRGIPLAEVVQWMARSPADLVGLTDRGRLAPGARADLVAFAPQEEFVVDPAQLAHRHPITPYAGRTLRGVVRRTWLGGDPVRDGVNRGRLVTRP